MGAVASLLTGELLTRHLKRMGELCGTALPGHQAGPFTAPSDSMLRGWLTASPLSTVVAADSALLAGGGEVGGLFDRSTCVPFLLTGERLSTSFLHF